MNWLKNTYRSDAKIGRFLGVLVLWGIGYGFYRGVQENYLVDIIQISAFERGIVEFFREMPGLLIVLILALMYKLTASRIFKIGIGIMAGGMAGILLTSSSEFFRTKLLVVIFMVVFSAGEHIIMPVRSTIALDLAKREKAGISLGISSSISQLGNIFGLAIVTLVFFLLGKKGFVRTDILGFRIVLGISFAVLLASVMVAAAMEETTMKANRQRIYFAKKFTKFYILEIFYGARKQVFITFAPFALVRYYGADPSNMAILLAVCAGFGILFGPLTGKIIDKLGYKVVMVADTIILVAVCLLYGYAHQIFPMNIAVIVVYVNFVLDSIISMASMATNVYVQRIASSQEELTATLSTGISVNHLISIIIALTGGLIWEVAGIERLFTLSAVLGLISSIYAATIKVVK